MTDPSLPASTIKRVPAVRYTVSLERFFSDLPSSDREQRVEAVVEQEKRGGTVFLYEANLQGTIAAAALAVAQAGKTAVVWPPRQFEEAIAAEVTQRLMDALQTELRHAGIRIAQALLESDETHQGEALQRAGFDRVGDLLYMISLPQQIRFVSPDEPLQPETNLEFVPYSTTNPERLEQVVEATYRETLDCPQLDGVRNIRDVLEGYRANGEFDPKRWFIIRQSDTDVGCLLLTDYPDTGHWELVYMGLVPEVRGQRLGIEVVRYAQNLARLAGRDRLILAVDAENKPAFDMYVQAGFEVWDRRRVFLKIYDP